MSDITQERCSQKVQKPRENLEDYLKRNACPSKMERDTCQCFDLPREEEFGNGIPQTVSRESSISGRNGQSVKVNFSGTQKFEPDRENRVMSLQMLSS